MTLDLRKNVEHSDLRFRGDFHDAVHRCVPVDRSECVSGWTLQLSVGFLLCLVCVVSL